MSEETYVPTSVDLTQGRLQLDSLLRLVSKKQRAAVDKLVALMESKDDKVASLAATTLLKLNVEIAEKMSADQLRRAIMQVKVGGGMLKQDNKPDIPMLNFDEVQDVDVN